LLIYFEACIAGSWAVVWYAWMRQITSKESRGTFLSTMRLGSQAFNALVVLGFGVIVGSRVTQFDYALLLAFLSIYLLFSIWQLQKIPETRAARQRTQPVLSRILPLLKDSKIARLLLVVVLNNFVTTPLLSLFAIDTLGLSPAAPSVVLSIKGVSVAAFMLLWGRLIDKHGANRVFRGLSMVLAVSTSLWAIMPLSRQVGNFQMVLFAIVVVTTSIVRSGMAVAFMNTVYASVTDDESVGAFSLLDPYESLSTAGLPFSQDMRFRPYP